MKSPVKGTANKLVSSFSHLKLCFFINKLMINGSLMIYFTVWTKQGNLKNICFRDILFLHLKTYPNKINIKNKQQQKKHTCFLTALVIILSSLQMEAN